MYDTILNRYTVGEHKRHVNPVCRTYIYTIQSALRCLSHSLAEMIRSDVVKGI